MIFLVVDDEALARRDLARVLKRVEKDATVHEAESAATALEICSKQNIDVVFLDIHMPGTDGLSLAKEMLRIAPHTNIIMVTAYPDYALEAHRLFVSGYILKPAMEEDVREALNHLRFNMGGHQHSRSEGLYVQCFGSFEVFYNGQTVRFGRSQSKELFAYLIDRRGASATNAECRAILWEDSATDSAKQRDYFHHIWAELKETLARIGCDDVLSQKRNAYAVNTDRLHCDYYDWIASGRPVEPYKEYMSQYSWAEGRII